MLHIFRMTAYILIFLPNRQSHTGGTFQMNESSNYTEYAVRQKPEGQYLVRRILLILLYVAFGVGYFCFWTVGPIKITPMIAILPIFEWMLVFCTWRYASVEQEYTMASGVITFTDIYGSRSRKKKLEYTIKNMTKIAPATDEYKSEWSDAGKGRTFDFRGSVSSPDSYFFSCQDKSGKKVVVFFEATAKALKIFRFYNPSATVVSAVRF